MSTSSTSRQPPSRTSARSPESFESLRQRAMAAETLQSYEKLSWFAFQRCETIAQTRMHFQRLVAGFSPEDEDELILWKEDFTPHPKKEGSGSGRKGKEKERASLGGGEKRKDRQSVGGGEGEKKAAE